MKVQKQKPTVEAIARMNELNKLIDAFWENLHDSYEDVNKLVSEQSDLLDAFHWHDTPFKENGKVGMMAADGKVVVPAQYDDWMTAQRYDDDENTPDVMIKDKKCGLVARDGKGTELTDFAYGCMKRIAGSNVYLVNRPDDPEKYALLMKHGQLLTPFELDSASEVCCSGMIYVYAGDKKGLLDLNADVYIAPQYEELYDEGVGSLVIGEKEGVQGYVTSANKLIPFDERDAFQLNEECETNYLLYVTD